MNEYTIIAVEKGGRVGGIAIFDSPNNAAIEEAKAYFVFRRGNTRIHVLVVSGNVTEESARKLAVNLYENKGYIIDFNDARTIDRNSASWRKFATP